MDIQKVIMNRALFSKIPKGKGTKIAVAIIIVLIILIIIKLLIG